MVNSNLLGVVATGTTRYTRTPDGTLLSRRSGTNRAYYLHDGLGSTAALVDATGTVRNRYTYDPYGQTTTTCPTNSCLSNPFQYTGAQHDQATGLYKIGHRYYQPEHGRWTQPDPSGFSLSGYLYSSGNPVNLIDPTGLIGIPAEAYTAASIILDIAAFAFPAYSLPFAVRAWPLTSVGSSPTATLAMHNKPLTPSGLMC